MSEYENNTKEVSMQNFTEQQIQEIVETGGGIYKGIQSNDVGYSTLVLFDDPTSLTTIAIKLEELSVQGIKDRLQSSREQFEMARKKIKKPTKKQKKKEERSAIKERKFKKDFKKQALKDLKEKHNG